MVLTSRSFQHTCGLLVVVIGITTAIAAANLRKGSSLEFDRGVFLVNTIPDAIIAKRGVRYSGSSRSGNSGNSDYSLSDSSSKYGTSSEDDGREGGKDPFDDIPHVANGHGGSDSNGDGGFRDRTVQPPPPVTVQPATTTPPTSVTPVTDTTSPPTTVTPVTDTATPPTLATATAPTIITSRCVPSQVCTEEDVLDITTTANSGLTTVSRLYSDIFDIFTADLYARSVTILIREANDPSSRLCADFTQLNGNVLQASQRSGPSEITFFFLQPISAGQTFSLSNAQVHFTLRSLPSFGNIQLRLSYNALGDLESSQRLIQPPGQSNPTVFFPFPILRTVCRPDPTMCADDNVAPTPPVPVPVPKPLPDIRPGDDNTAISMAFAGQCIG